MPGVELKSWSPLQANLMAAFCLGFGASHAAAQSQASSGQIAGDVTDPNGAVIPGANVMAVNTGTGIMRSTVTDATPRA